ncbi:MAG TPA: bifunctional diaminohydroxyphosphoribosylaminopyrimidine deaminase/5-amino-6-(5-phosphoribosylamino)uracil reductase RibD [Gemmatimonadales bacterium]|nr:bifunctional diaminohydroxyphosphoribosylaminopyrimidine deaminase/5-amino-6-(5-phosphoribosylamino)uracil reductase RibD [Gemmatimonadales bacterium]
MDDREAMRRAIALAWGGWGRVGRNPLVGALVLRDGAVVGEGFHAEFGGRHGEVAALEAAGRRARGADLVVSLEPCVHYGKTPPCTDAIVAAGIRRVVFGARDVDPKARGGAEALRRAGVRVEPGVLEREVQAQNALFFHRFAGKNRPFVALKLAVSLDGKIADHRGHSRWVSGGEAREYVHWLRAGFDAVAVGAGTAAADDPSLTVRGPVEPARPPLRVILDRRGEVPLGATVVTTARETPTLVLLGRDVPATTRAALAAAGVEVADADGPRDAQAVLSGRGVASVLIEGGGVVAGRWLKEELVDRIYLISAPILLGGDGVPAFAGLPGADIEAVKAWRTVDRRTLGNDSLLVMDRP